MFYIDPVYFWFVFIPVIIISLGVQLYLRSTFSKWSKVRNTAGLAGPLVAREIWARAEKAFKDYEVFFESRWEGWCTEAWPAPCSDGEYAYVATANNAVAAVSS